jgi:inhibitor of cysteine peptidase
MFKLLWPVAAAAAAFMACAAAGPARVDMPESIILTEQDEGKTVDVHVGQTVIVSLPENASTGYRWAIEHADPSLVEAREAEPRYPSGAVGAGGRAQWVFLAKIPGTTLITLKQLRPWEGDASIVGRFHVQLRVLP